MAHGGQQPDIYQSSRQEDRLRYVLYLHRVEIQIGQS